VEVEFGAGAGIRQYARAVTMIGGSRLTAIYNRAMEQRKIETIVLTSLKKLLESNTFLLEYGVHEQVVTQKLAAYIQQQLPSLSVDCEYNKHGLKTKRLPRTINGSDKAVRPDIVVHTPGNDDSNLLVIEAKLNAATVPESDDIKLQEFTKPDGDYKYRFGLFIGFNKLATPQLVWYVDGHQTVSLVSMQDL
jgi:hypothetical protein